MAVHILTRTRQSGLTRPAPSPDVRPPAPAKRGEREVDLQVLFHGACRVDHVFGYAFSLGEIDNDVPIEVRLSRSSDDVGVADEPPEVVFVEMHEMQKEGNVVIERDCRQTVAQ